VSYAIFGFPRTPPGRDEVMWTWSKSLARIDQQCDSAVSWARRRERFLVHEVGSYRGPRRDLA
jgi:hypothetical protein